MYHSNILYKNTLNPSHLSLGQRTLGSKICIEGYWNKPCNILISLDLSPYPAVLKILQFQ